MNSSITFDDMMSNAAAIRAAEEDMKNFKPRVVVSTVKKSAQAPQPEPSIIRKLPAWFVALVRSSQELYLFGRTNLFENRRIVKNLVARGQPPLWSIGEVRSMVADARRDIQLISRGC